MSDIDYPFTVRSRLVIEFSDLPGCISDGETITETIASGEDAKRCWITAMR